MAVGPSVPTRSRGRTNPTNNNSPSPPPPAPAQRQEEQPRSVWSTKSRNQWSNLFVEFICSSSCEQQQRLIDVVSAFPLEQRHVAYDVDCMDLVNYEPILCQALLESPAEALCVFDEALLVAQERLLKSRLCTPEWKLRTAHARLSNCPPLMEHRKANISAIRAGDVGSLVEVKGTVVRTGSVRMLETSRCYQCCAARCGETFNVDADREQGNVLEKPAMCKGKVNGKQCMSKRFTEVTKVTADYQEVRLQEHVEELEMGSIPRSINCTLEDDLADKCKAGDDVTIVGFLLRRWQPVHRDVRCDVDLVLTVNSMQVSASSTLGVARVTTEDLNEFASFWRRAEKRGKTLRARDAFVSSVCPQIFGRRTVKLALLLTLIGGVGSEEEEAEEEDNDADVKESDGRRRGTPHLLLVGDPGTGKSQFLRFTAKLAPRCVLTTGCGTTSAGLTCSAVKDAGEWVLEAGALVLADRGVCCIDEFASIRGADRATIHEAMEQQTLSIAKAGLVCKLNSRATIIAVCNPKGGKYDHTSDLSVNTSIPPPLLSRFDLVLLVEDNPDPDWDRAATNNVLNAALHASEGLLDNSPSSDEEEEEGIVAATQRRLKKRKVVVATNDNNWGMDKLRKYLAHVKSTLQPKLDSSAGEVIQRYYSLQRQQMGAGRGRTTIRMLESLVRVSQAHARLMCRGQVHQQDAVIATLLVDRSMMADSLFAASTEVIPSPSQGAEEDSDAYYDYQRATVLEALGIDQNNSRASTSSYST